MIDFKIRLLYFSPTGTTRKILEAIAAGLGENKAKHIDLTLASTSVGRKKNIKGGLTIIGVPVYTGRVALEAVGRLQQLKAMDAPAVVVVVYGNREYEDALLELRNLAMETGFTPIAGAAFIGGHSFSTQSAPIAHGRPDHDDLKHARSFGVMVKDKLKQSREIEVVPKLNVPGNFPYRERGPARNTSPETNDSICLRCEKCKEVCPTEAIAFYNGLVKTDKEKYILFCACIKNCPSGAKQLNDSQLIQFIQKLSVSCNHRKEPEFFL